MFLKLSFSKINLACPPEPESLDLDASIAYESRSIPTNIPSEDNLLYISTECPAPPTVPSI
jgi:hypothetical protein